MSRITSPTSASSSTTRIRAVCGGAAATALAEAEPGESPTTGSHRVHVVADPLRLRLVLPTGAGHFDDVADDDPEVHRLERPRQRLLGELLDALDRPRAVLGRGRDGLEPTEYVRRVRGGTQQLRAAED